MLISRKLPRIAKRSQRQAACGGWGLWQLLPSKASSISSISATLCPSLPQEEDPVEKQVLLVHTARVCSCGRAGRQVPSALSISGKK
jgi:hypothetical protein